MTAPIPDPCGGLPAAGEAGGAMWWRRLLWPLVQSTLFQLSLHSAYRFRVRLLRLFGARLEDTVRFRRTARIDRPWNLEIGRKSNVADGCVLLARRPIRIGARSVVSQYSILSTCEVIADTEPIGVRFEPITVGDDAWIATECYVAAGSDVPDGTLVAARSVVRGRLEPWTIAAGMPAVTRGAREYSGRSAEPVVD